MRNAYRILVRKSLRKRPFGRQKRRWEYNIKINAREAGCEDGRWMELAQDHVQWRLWYKPSVRSGTANG
jgi:hypothetical protein